MFKIVNTPQRPAPLTVEPHEQQYIFQGLRLLLKKFESNSGYNNKCERIVKLIDKLVKYREELRNNV